MTDVGGVLSLVIFMFGLIVAPVAKFNFTMAAANKLFYGRIKQPGIFHGKIDNRA